MFIAAVLTIAKIWKQLKCSQTDEWIKMCYIYTMEYYLTIKKEYICSNMDGPRDYDSLSKVSQRGNTVCHPLYVESKKKWYKWTYLQNRKRLTALEKTLMAVRGWGMGKG